MRFLRLLAARVRGWFHHDGVADEIREELTFHLRSRVEQYEREGMEPDAAQRAARRRVGNLALHQDRGYDVRGGGLMETIWQDVRYAVRLLRQRPGFSAIAILTLALGIGASTAIFSVIDAALLHPLPYPHPEQLVSVGVRVPQPDGRILGLTPSLDDMRRWQSARDVLSTTAAMNRSFYGIIAGGPEPERLEARNITEDYFPLYGVAPIMGRGFTLDDMKVGAPPVAILGYGYWQRRYGGSRDVLGKPIRCDDDVATIVGVLPKSFDADIPLFRPMQTPLDEASRRGTGRVSPLARLRDGVTIEQAAERLSARMPPVRMPDGSMRPVGVRVSSMLDDATGQYQTTVYVLGGAVAFILLIACVNVAGLLLGRGAVRQSELAVRASLGAGRRRLVRQLLTESVVLAVAGAVCGVLMAWATLGALVANIPMSLSDNAPAHIDLTVLALTSALVIPTSLIFGLAPALRLSRMSLNAALGRGGRQLGTALSRRGGQLLIAAEVALAVVLVAGAGLMIRTFMRISAVDLGFDSRGLITMDVTPLEGDPQAQLTYLDALLRAVRAIPGAGPVGAIDNFPLGGRTSFTSVTADGRNVGIMSFQVLAGYFDAIGLPLRAGALPPADDTAAWQHAGVLSESAAKDIFPDGPAVGRQFTRGGSPDPLTVVAVVADIRHGGPLARVREEHQVYLPFQPAKSGVQRNLAVTLVLRPSGKVPDLSDRLRKAAQNIGPRVLVERIRTGSDWFGDRVVTPRRRTVLLGVLGGLGLLLTLVGVFGMTAYAVARRTQEIGVRMVFGALPGAVVRRILRESAMPIALGIAAGLGGAALATRLIASFLFQTDPIDLPTFAGVAVLLLIAGGLAAWLPARRAARIDPVRALRTE